MNATNLKNVSLKVFLRDVFSRTNLYKPIKKDSNIQTAKQNKTNKRINKIDRIITF